MRAAPDDRQPRARGARGPAHPQRLAQRLAACARSRPSSSALPRELHDARLRRQLEAAVDDHDVATLEPGPEREQAERHRRGPRRGADTGRRAGAVRRRGPSERRSPPGEASRIPEIARASSCPTPIFRAKATAMSCTSRPERQREPQVVAHGDDRERHRQRGRERPRQRSAELDRERGGPAGARGEQQQQPLGDDDARRPLPRRRGAHERHGHGERREHARGREPRQPGRPRPRPRARSAAGRS